MRLPLHSASQVVQRSYATGVVDTAIPGWSHSAEQTSSGALSGGARELHLEGLQLLEEHYRGVTTNHYGVAPPHCVGFVIPSRSHSDGMFDGQPWPPNTICVWDTDREFNAIVPPMNIFCIVLDKAVLFDHVARTEHIEIDRALQRTGLTIDASHASEWLAHRFAEMLDAGFEMEPDKASFATQRAMRQEVLEILAPLLVSKVGDQRSPTLLNELNTVRRAREVVLSNPDTPVQIQDLCETLNISQRKLQKSFQSVLGLSPLTYLRTLRLNGAHRDLLSGRPVKEVIETWGFWHWSRFSSEYRELFGELPSTTASRRQVPRFT